jgi:hypothetical protein
VCWCKQTTHCVPLAFIFGSVYCSCNSLTQITPAYSCPKLREPRIVRHTTPVYRLHTKFLFPFLPIYYAISETDGNTRSFVNCSINQNACLGSTPPQHANPQWCFSHHADGPVLPIYRWTFFSPHLELLRLSLHEGFHCHPNMFWKCKHCTYCQKEKPKAWYQGSVCQGIGPHLVCIYR